MTPEKILLVRLRLIGDVVFTTPLIHALRRRFPNAFITYLVEAAARPIVESNPHLNEVLVAERGGGLRQLRADLALAGRLRARGYDLAIDLHGGPRSSLLTWLSAATQRIGYEVTGRSWMYTTSVARPRELRPRHSVENQWDLLGPLGISPPHPAANPVEMAVDLATASRIAHRLTQLGLQPTDRLILIHVSAGNRFRRWPRQAFVALIASLAASDPTRKILVVSGPSEDQAAAVVIDDARARLPLERRDQVPACGHLSITELRALCEHAALFIGGDSGPLHVAATSAVPIVALYGPTLPIRSAPWRSPTWISEAIEVRDLPCRPCDQRRCVPGDFRCLTSIQPADVLQAAERALARAGGSVRRPPGPNAGSTDKMSSSA